MAKISFIIPCFNAENLLEKCFSSLSEQTFKDVEYIFVDDGSTDFTKYVIETFIQSEPRAKLISQINQGITKARLAGLKHASGDFVTFVDSDDFIDIGAAEEALSIFNSNEKIDAVLYSLVYAKDGGVETFKYSMSFPISGYEVLKFTIPSWRITTAGFYKRAYAVSAYAGLNLVATNSDEMATRSIFELCRQVEKMYAKYYYVHNPESISKTPSKSYITRLESARWLRDYSISKLSNHVSRKDADTLYINELCDMAIKYHNLMLVMDVSTRSIWLRGIYEHRQNLLKIFRSALANYPLGVLFDLKMLKKIVYILGWPLIKKARD
ncbi:MAG: glycosyltransferase family 2 protein [Gallionella sp.]|nr:glycosyltransferase family 2 protein [Gallionella sp.]